MINIEKYIFEKLHLDKVNIQPSDIFAGLIEDIDISEWQWPEHGVSVKQYAEYQENVRNFALKTFNNKNYMEDIYKCTYKLYMQTDVVAWPAEKIEKTYKSQLGFIERHGWDLFEKNCIETGWWIFVDWLIKQINK